MMFSHRDKRVAITYSFPSTRSKLNWQRKRTFASSAVNALRETVETMLRAPTIADHKGTAKSFSFDSVDEFRKLLCCVNGQ